MKLFSRRALAASAVVLLALLPARSAVQVTPWPQANSDLPADTSVRFGVLPNGMRYAIKHNATPTGAVSIRFRIDAGSLMERDDEQGIAHMLEHMAFRGSAHVADGDVVKKLQSLGLTFGADTNAFTYPTQTVYSFDMPKNDAPSVDTGLLLIREIASELNISGDSLNTERKVVLAEGRLRDVPVSHLRKADLAFLYGPRAAAALTPIGLDDIITNASPELLRGFYEAWYRPERATLMIVGDVDPDQIEAKIKAMFSDWKAKAPPRPVPAYRAPTKYPRTLSMFAESGAQPYILFSWVKPHDTAPDNKANETRDVMRYIALSILNQRFATMAHGASPPFIGAQVSFDRMADIADTTEIVATYRSGDLTGGLKSVERSWRAAVQYGVRQDEVDQIVAQLRTFFQGNAASADTTASPEIANALVRSLDEKSVFTSPASDLVLFEAVVKGITVDKVNKAMREAFSGNGPLVFTSSALIVTGGEKGLKDALADADATPTAATAASAALPPWPYGDFGKPGTVASRRTVDDLGVTFVRYDNGVTLTIKPTQYHVGQILMSVRVGKGRIGLSRDTVSPVWALNGMFIQGGLARYSVDDLQKRMADKLWGASLSVGDDEFVLRGQSRPSDLKSELEVLAAYVTDPAWPSTAFDQARLAYAGSYVETQTSPSGTLSREFYGMLHNGDKRWATPTILEIEGTKLDDAKALFMPALSGGPLDITIVGDVTEDQAIASVAATFGTLPHRAEGGPVKGDERFPAPTPQPLVLTHRGASNQAVAAIVWPTTGFMHDMKLQRTLRVLSEIFSQRLLDELRTREGITYTPGASTYSSTVTRDYGFLYALAQIPPDKIATFYTQVDVVAADLADKPVSEDELERARGPRIEDIQKQRQTNEYWLGLLGGAQQDPRMLDVIRTTIPDLKSVTAEDVRRAAREWLRSSRAYRVVVVPEGFTPPQLTH